MIQKLKIIVASSYLDTLSSFRIKEALFFGIAFPLLLFILFGYIWGANTGYIPFIMSGMVAMTITSDTLYGIGPIIGIYKKNNLLKFLKNLPVNIVYHFFGLFISKIILMIIVLLALFICGILLFDYFPAPHDIFLYLAGICIGIILFGFMGLVLSFLTKDQTGRGLINFIYFIMLFISGTFYSTEAFSPALKIMSNFFPLTHLLLFIRGDLFYLGILIVWIIFFLVLFMIVVKKTALKR